MRRKLSLVTAGLLAGATLSVGAVSPAQAQPHGCTAQDPVLAYVCRTIGSIPDPNPWVQHYYDQAGKAVKLVYCTVWPHLCP